MAQEHVGAFSVGDTITVYPVGEIELIEDVGESFKYHHSAYSRIYRLWESH